MSRCAVPTFLNDGNPCDQPASAIFVEPEFGTTVPSIVYETPLCPAHVAQVEFTGYVGTFRYLRLPELRDAQADESRCACNGACRERGECPQAVRVREQYAPLILAAQRRLRDGEPEK